MGRSVRELIEVDDPAWPLIEGWIAGSHLAVQRVPLAQSDGETELSSVQVTLRSVLGALAYHTGGLLLDRGWLKVLGARSQACPWSISGLTASMGWARGEAPPSAVAVGLDVLGGVFAINGGAMSRASMGHVFYFDPTALSWDDLNIPHSRWVESMLDRSRLSKFYEGLRWPGWESEVQALSPSQGVGFYPPLWTTESRPISRANRGVTSLDELVSLQFEFARQLGQ